MTNKWKTIHECIEYAGSVHRDYSPRSSEGNSKKKMIKNENEYWSVSVRSCDEEQNLLKYWLLIKTYHCVEFVNILSLCTHFLPVVHARVQVQRYLADNVYFWQIYINMLMLMLMLPNKNLITASQEIDG